MQPYSICSGLKGLRSALQSIARNFQPPTALPSSLISEKDLNTKGS